MPGDAPVAAARPAAGPTNSITDVAGVSVGHHHRIDVGWATGVTAVLVPDGAVGAVDGRGGAPGTRETDLLEPSNMVRRAHAVCLAGGSAYGLAAADGVMRWLGERGHGLSIGAEPHEVVPIVPAAVLFDLPRSTWGNRPDAEFGYAACVAAGPGPVAMGCVGAGTGAKLGSLKGGIGTASLVLPPGPAGGPGPVLGALVAANAVGEAVDLDTGRPWAAVDEVAGEFGVRWPDRPASVRPGVQAQPLNTTIGVVAVDVALSKAQCRRLAMAAHDGLARAVRPAHTMFDGDTMFALATGRRPLLPGDAQRGAAGEAGDAVADAVELDRLCVAAADVVARAIVRALLAAESLAGLTAYRQVWPEAFGR